MGCIKSKPGLSQEDLKLYPELVLAADDDEDALAALRKRRVTLSLENEFRAAVFLEKHCDTELAKFCRGAKCGQKEVLARVSADAEDADSRSTVAMAVAYVADDRGFYSMLRLVAQAVHTLIAERHWPNFHQEHAIMASLSTEVLRYVELWSRLYWAAMKAVDA